MDLYFTDEVKQFIKNELKYADQEGEKKINEFLKVLYVCKNIPELTNYQALSRKILNQANTFITTNTINEDIDLGSFNEVNEFLEVLLYLRNPKFLVTRKEDSENIPKYLGPDFLNLITKKEKKSILDVVNNNSNKKIKFGIYNFEKSILNAYARCYEIRNKEAHSARDYNLTERISVISSIFEVYLELSHIFKQEIDRKYRYVDLIYNTSAEEYVRNFQNEYRKKHIKYIILEGEAENVNKQTLPNLIVKNKHVKIVGEAGMGKSTTLEYMVHNEMNNFSQTGVLPVFIPLCDYLEEHDAIKNKIATNILKCDINYVEKIMKQGDNIILYLDGLNEIDDDKKQNVVGEINQMLSLYPNLRIIITDRDVSNTGDLERIGITTNIKSYKIKYLNAEQINEFIDKNGIDDETKEKVKALLNTEEKLEKVKKPLILKYLIEAVRAKVIDELPNDDDTFAILYIKSILKREEEKRTPGAKYLSNYLSKIAETIDNETDNSWKNIITRNKILEVISEETNNLHLTEIKSDKILELILQMGFIQEKDYMEYSFSNEDYFNYFSSI